MILLQDIQILLCFVDIAVTHTAYKGTQDIYNLQGFLKASSDLTSKLQSFPCYISLGSTPQLFCQSFTFSLNENKTQQNPDTFFHVIQFSFLSTIFLFYFGNPFTWLSCFLPASLPVHQSHPVHLSLAGGITFARESLLCVLQHILLCSLSSSSPRAVHFLGNISVLKGIGVILLCKHSEASAMHKDKERKQGEC